MKGRPTRYLFFVFVAAAALELFGVAYFGARYGILFYRTSPQNIGSDTEKFAEIAPADYLLHPYFGFTRVPGSTFYTGPAVDAKRRNNDGFDSENDLPYEPSDPSEIIVGIFGASVAGGIVVTDPESFRLALEKMPALSGKKVTILSFCREMYKQPQSLLILAYYLSMGQRFDIIINIDGYTEITNGLQDIVSGLEEGMPSVGGIRGTEAQWGMLGHQAAKQFYRSVAASALTKVNHLIKWNRSAFLGAILDMARIRIAETTQRLTSELVKQATSAGSTEQEPVLLGREKGAAEDLEPLRTISALWAKASIEMNDLAESSGALYFHVLPPNQYYGERKFSTEEAKIAFGGRGRGSGKLVTDGYAELLRRSKELRRDGVRFIDATAAFDHVDGPVYSDAIAHYNQRGGLIMQGFIAHEIAGILAEEGRTTLGHRRSEKAR